MSNSFDDFDYSIFDDDFTVPPPQSISKAVSKEPTKRPGVESHQQEGENSTDYLLNLIKRSRVETGDSTTNKGATSITTNPSQTNVSAEPRFCSINKIANHEMEKGSLVQRMFPGPAGILPESVNMLYKKILNLIILFNQ